MTSSLRPIDSDTLATGKQRTKYQRVFDHLYAEYRAGRLSPGQALPGEAKLSEILGVSRNTLRHALAKLEDDGMVERVHGRGTFFTSEQQRDARKKRDEFAFLAPELRLGIYPSLIAGFENACAIIQHQMVVSNTSNDVHYQADLLMQLMDKEIGGVALVPATVPTTPPYQLSLLQKNSIPVVCCHRTVAGVNTPSVVFSGFENGQKAAQAFLDRGHRRIAFLFGHRYSMVEEREAGMQSAIKAHPDSASCELQSVEFGSLMSATDQSSRAAICAALKQLLSKPDRPTAIFCGSVNEAEQVYLQCNELGLSIPGDVSLLCFGSKWREGALAQRISGVCVDEYAIGIRAAELLHEMRVGKRPIDNNEQVIFPLSLFEGETLGSV
jgi:DNA-binding LacI/PurR family transcriptional regulator